MKKRKVLIFLLCLAIPLFVFAEEKVKVKKVLDGDTIITEKGEVIRYIGIDCPENGYYNEDREFVEDPQPLFEEALEANRKLVEGKTVTLEFDAKKKDDFGRTLAYVYVDGKMVNTELLKEGYARTKLTDPNTSYREEFLQLEWDAQDKRLGIWGQ